ncbi:MAG TPA: FtsW/RodA/SpoVE family cell cycle protein [Solirubrobacterales bacterium]|nr:FtsW/RodA/SpoVE family cell cycle protein [Solirubrobacterales bacterium]
MESSRATRGGVRPYHERTQLLDWLGIRNMDGWIAFSALGLMACSLFTLHQASRGAIPGAPDYYLQRQALYGLVGIVAMFAISRVDYSRFRELRVGIYTFLCASIFAVFTFGVAARGSTNSLELPFFTFQPAELGKVLLVLSLAGFVIDGVRRGSEGQRTIRILALGFAPTGLVLLQDLGTSLVFGAITIAIMVAAGVRWTHLAAIGAALVVFITTVLVLMPMAGTPVLKEYQQERLTSFLAPSSNIGDAGYQQNQAKVAAGSGGTTGRGDQATQSRLGFVPERHTDFIFAVVAERYGFVGAALVLSLFALLFWRALRLMTLSKNFYGTLVAAGIAAAIMFQVFVNVGMNLGIMPITGIPLPLMSYGGSAVIATFLMIGVLQSIHIESRAGQKGPWIR